MKTERSQVVAHAFSTQGVKADGSVNSRAVWST